MSGTELLNEISMAEYLKVKPVVIMISGNDQFNADAFIQSKQILAFLPKPLRTDLLTDRVAQILEMA